MRKTLATATFAAALLVGAATAAGANPSFGPGGSDGNGNNDPQEQGASCHPPGQTDTLPQCK